MMERFSIGTIAKHALRRHKTWGATWTSGTLKPAYDVVIIGAGGHGLGAAYYLAKEHGVRSVAVLERSWIGGGNTARNTMTIRDNFTYPANIKFHHEAVKLWQGLTEELNYNVMLSKRGMVTLLMSPASMDRASKMVNSVNAFGLDHRLISSDKVLQHLPNISEPARYKILGGIYHPNVYMSRHDSVAWGFARAASSLGVDIIQNCEVIGIRQEGGRVTGVDTTRGVVRAGKVGSAVAGHSSVVAAMANIRIPVQTWALQAFVSTPVKPMLDPIVVLSDLNTYFMQSDKGELVMGGTTDPYPSYAQRGTPAIPESVVANILSIFPQFGSMKVLRQWAGVLDVTYDNSPIISKTEIEGFYMDIAGSGGWKTTPLAAKMLADLIVKDAPHPLIEPLGLQRFETGRLMLEKASYGNR